jgi:hypothetical protein
MQSQNLDERPQYTSARIRQDINFELSLIASERSRIAGKRIYAYQIMEEALLDWLKRIERNKSRHPNVKQRP